MGLSSSQARLLSLTSRVHDIEYRAQRTEAQKLQLANESDRVYETYLDALEKKKIVANLINQNGEYYETPLTARSVYTYKQLYEQYDLKTAGGKILIPDNLHNYYQNNDSLSGYLDALGISETKQVYKLKEKPNPLYEEKYNEWKSDLETYQLDYKNWQKESASYPDKLAAWQAIEPQEENEKYWTTTTSTLGADFETAGGYCYGEAVNHNDTGCYQHVLQHIIDYTVGKGYNESTSDNNSSWYNGVNNKYETSISGQTIVVSTPNGGCHSTTNNQTFNKVSEQVSDETACIASDANDGYAIRVTNSSSNWDKLVSKYKTDGTLKSMKQWAIDLYYLCSNYSTMGKSAQDVAQTVTAFQSNLVSTLKEFDEPQYTSDHIRWETYVTEGGEKPVEPEEWTRLAPVLEDYVGDIPQTIDDGSGYIDCPTFTDKDYAQWYINLWAKMNGSDETPKIIETIEYDDETNNDIVLYSVEDIPKTETTYTTNPESGAVESDNYIVIPEDKLDDPDWIRNAVGEGFVLIQQWTSSENKFKDVSLGSCTRISEVPDTIDIKKAEAQYEADINRINRKDAQYDALLSAFETERNALKNEIDTLKTVAKDNVDRTFKLFS